MISIATILDVAADLASDQGENPEYDRALVELVSNLLPGGTEGNREAVAALISKKRGA